MFFVINKIEVSTHRTDKLQNPKTPGEPMLLDIYRTHMRTAVCNVYSKKAFCEFWDDGQAKKIPRRLWTAEMKAYSSQKLAEVTKPPYIFKLTIVGWIFLLFIFATFGLIIYEEVKPPLPKSEEHVAMEKTPVAGDVFFGHYEVYKEKGSVLGAKIGFGWFKVVTVDGDNYYLTKSTEMSKSHKPKEQLNSTAFEAEGMPPLKLAEQTGYNIRFKSPDMLTEVYITDKK